MAKKIKHDKREGEREREREREREDKFAATPPLEAKKLLLSLWASMDGMCLDFIDAVRA